MKNTCVQVHVVHAIKHQTAGNAVRTHVCIYTLKHQNLEQVLINSLYVGTNGRSGTKEGIKVANLFFHSMYCILHILCLFEICLLEHLKNLRIKSSLRFNFVLFYLYNRLTITT